MEGKLKVVVESSFTGVQEMNADVWAEEFCSRNLMADRDCMRSWFANAIMAGYDKARNDMNKRERLVDDMRQAIHFALEALTVAKGKDLYYTTFIFQVNKAKEALEDILLKEEEGQSDE